MKRRINILILTLALFTTIANAQQPEKGIKFFKGNWEEALAKSKKENKMIFLDCFTQWCVPCKEMATDVFTQQKVADYYNENYINLSIDMEKGEGQELRAQFAINNYPALLYFKPGGFLIAHETGRKDAVQLIADGMANLQKIDTITLEERFEKGGYADAGFLKYYFKETLTTKATGQEQFAVDKIIKLEGIDALYKKKNWDMIAVASAGSQAGLFLVKNHAKFAELYGEAAVNSKIMSMYFNVKFLNWYGDQYLTKKDVYDEFKGRMKDRKVPELAFMLMAVDFHIACREGKFDEAFKLAEPFLLKGKGWQYYGIARLGDWFTAGRLAEREKVMKWAQKALLLAKTTEEKNNCQELINDLKKPWTDLVLTPKIYDYNI